MRVSCDEPRRIRSLIDDPNGANRGCFADGRLNRSIHHVFYTMPGFRFLRHGETGGQVPQGIGEYLPCVGVEALGEKKDRLARAVRVQGIQQIIRDLLLRYFDGIRLGKVLPLLLHIASSIRAISSRVRPNRR